MRYVKQDGDGPLCPMSTGEHPHPAHRAAIDESDVVWTAAEPYRDADGEYTDPAVEALVDVASARYRQHMKLYVTQGSTWELREKRTYIEAWFWQCPVCNFVLPAVARSLP